MTTEIAVRGDDQQPESGMHTWAENARIAGHLAVSLSKTSYVAASMRGKVEEVAAAILAGAELGLPPIASLRAVDIIQGTPALRAHAMRGLVQSRGHQVQVVETGPTRCVVRGRRKGDEEWQQVEWTIERAAQMGLTQKAEWKKQPGTMLVNRATSEMCRLIAADVLYAMPYAAEELEPAGDGGTTVTRVTAADYLGPTVDTATGEVQDVQVEDPPGWGPTDAA